MKRSKQHNFSQKTAYHRKAKISGESLVQEAERIYKRGYEDALDACLKFLEPMPEAANLLLKFGRAILMDGILPKIPVKKEDVVTEGSGNVFADLGFSDAKKRLADAKARRAPMDDLDKDIAAQEVLTPGFAKRVDEALARRRVARGESKTAVKKSKRAGSHKCEVCGGKATHGEHWYSSIRYWCEQCTPWSGHYEFCPNPCKKLMRGKKAA